MSLPVFYREQHRIHGFGATPKQWAVTAILLFCIAMGLGAAAGRLWTDASQQVLPLSGNPTVDAAQVEAATTALAKGTEAFAAQRMNRGIQQALAGRHIQEV